MSLFESKKKKYFKHKYNGVQKMIWDLEFKREKTLMIREEVRREYDGTAAKFGVIDGKIKSQLATPDTICEVHNPEEGKPNLHKDIGKCACNFILPEAGFIGVAELEGLYDKKQLLTNDRERYIAQMKQMDLDVNGSPKTNEYPDGVEGINQNLEALRELQGMIKIYIKAL